MIKINLLGEEIVQSGSGRFIPLAFGASVLLLTIAFYLHYNSINSTLVDTNAKIEALNRQLQGLKERTKEVRALTEKKKELTDKLSIIATLKKNKTGPVKLLDEINTAIPEKAWLGGLEEGSGELKIKGQALDDQTVAQFMKELELSDYFLSVQLLETKSIPRNGVLIKDFSLVSKVSYAGKSFMSGANLAGGSSASDAKAPPA